jgi:hypothetical protein
MRPETPRYDVALSFAGEDRRYVDDVAQYLQAADVKVFYDDYEKTTLWGKDLYVHLDWVYREASRYCVIFISSAYAKKVWTNHERASAQARALEENTEYVLPARFDNTVIPGLRPTIGYLDISAMAPEELGAEIVKKLGPKRAAPGFPTNLDRYYEVLGLDDTEQDARQEARAVALSLYEALERMTSEERRVVAGVFAFGCGAELPTGVHISLDLLSRMTGLAKAQIIESLKGVRSLGVSVRIREEPFDHDEDELVPDDKDILLSFFAPRAPAAGNPTWYAMASVLCAADHFCADHGLEIITRLIFDRLAGGSHGPMAVD